MDNPEKNDGELFIEFIKRHDRQVFIVLKTFFVSCLVILAFYGGAIHTCNQIEGTLDSKLKCWTPKEMESLNSGPKFDKDGMLIINTTQMFMQYG